MSVTAYPTLRLKLTMPQALKLQFLPAVPGSNAAAAAAAAQAAADAAQAAANTAVAATADKVSKSGDVMTGFLTLNANPNTNLQAATKQYVDSQVSAGGITPQLPVVGGHLAGFIDSTGHVIREVKVGATMSIDGTGTLNTTAGGGNVIASGTPLVGQWARWTSAATIEGVDASATGFQPLDADLTSIAAATVTNQWLYRSAANTWSPVTIGANLTFTGGTLAATGGGGAPVGAEYITSTADATLTSERVLTDTATVTWDRTVAGQIKANAAGGGGASISISDTPPGSPTAGSMWWESDTGTLWIYYTDANSSAWVAAASAGSGALDQTTARQNIYAAPFDALAYNGMQINGSMEVSQELGTTARTTSGYVIDGINVIFNGGMAITAAQVADAPPGLTNSVKITITTAKASLAGSDYTFLQMPFEGYRTARLAFGTASAQSVSIGFWTKIHRTGTYSGALENGALNRSYPFTFVQNVADAWEFKTVTIPGDTAGTWIGGTNAASWYLVITMAVGSTLTAPANAWVAGNFVGANGTTNGVAATSDTFQITGLIVLPGIELPSAARSPFIMRPYDQELQTCMRYYWRDASPNWFYAESVSTGVANNNVALLIQFRPTMRATPTLTAPTLNLIGCNVPTFTTVTASACVAVGQSNVAAGGRLTFYYASGSFIADARL